MYRDEIFYYGHRINRVRDSSDSHPDTGSSSYSKLSPPPSSDDGLYSSDISNSIQLAGTVTVLMDAGRRHRLLVASLLLSAVCLAAAPAAVSARKVSLALYYESLCPYSANFIVNFLAKIFDNGLISIVDVDLVPYGNARVGSNATIKCQHGPYECLLNTIEACAISVWPDLNEHFSFIYCVEHLVLERKYPEWETCFQKTGLDSHAILECYTDGYGKKLELQYATKTDSLQPPHQYVPWVVVDGQPLYEDYENFEAYICKAYDGELPKACEGLTFIKEIKVDQVARVCHTDEMIISITKA